nr:reverse transcriptase domain-containing protein [Tanacetum cinerariifolium]
MSYKEPPITPTGVNQQEPVEVTKDTEPQNSDDIHPPTVQAEVQVDKPTNEPVVVIPKAKPNLPYPSRLQKEKNQEKDDILAAKFMEIFRDLHFELIFADALIYMPKFAPMFKKLLNNKDKLIELTKMPFNENCLAVVLKKLPKKLGDPGRFLIPCDFTGLDNCLALADLRASINLIPLSIWKKLRLPTLNDMKMVLELANRTISKPTGVAENVFVKVGDNGKWPVIIAKDLSSNEKTDFINILKTQKKAIAWKLTDIKGIDPEFCSHKILLEEDYSLKVQSQRRVNPKIHDVIKKEVKKLLDARLIYPISDSPWRCMMAIFHDMIEKTMEVFMDDFSVFGNSFSTCLTNLENMLKSNLAVGAVLGQRTEKHFRPIHYASKTMNQAEANYTTTEKEMFAEFDFKVIDTHGAKNYAADHLSRLENPYENVFDPKEINKTFPLESLNKVANKYPSTPWYADLANYHAGNFIIKASKEAIDILNACHSRPTGGHYEASYTTKKVFDSAYHLQTSGQVEVTNRGLKRILERTVGENHASWSDKLEDALWAFRTAFKTSIGCTPYRLVYGKACYLPLVLEHKAYWALKHTNFDLKTTCDHRKLHLNKLNELRDQAYENSLIYKERTKKLHDDKIKNRIFNVGNQVLLFNSRLKIFSGKLKSRWSDPFTIFEIYPYSTAKLIHPDGCNFKVNCHRLKHYHGGDLPSLKIPDVTTFPKDN